MRKYNVLEKVARKNVRWLNGEKYIYITNKLPRKKNVSVALSKIKKGVF